MKNGFFLSIAILLFLVPIPFSLAQTAPEGKFLTFNGIDQHLRITDHPDLNIAVGKSYTLTCRMKPDNFDAQYSILSKGNQMGSGGQYEFYTYNSAITPNVALSLRNSEDTNLGSTFFSTLEAGKWIHLAWVYSAGEKKSKIYIDGVLLSTVTHAAIGRDKVENPDELLVGCSLTDAVNPVKHQFWPGQLDELRIWDRALTGKEVLADRSAYRPNYTDLIAAYDFEFAGCDTVPDLSGHQHTAILFGYGIQVVKNRLPAGIGELNNRLLAFRISSYSPDESVRGITVDLTGTTDISDISRLNCYYNGAFERLNLKSATLFGSAVPNGTKTTLIGNCPMPRGYNYFWITADISPNAREGNQIHATVLSYIDGNGVPVSVPDVRVTQSILLANKLLFSSNDAGARNYRIPALVTARDGSLITATDKRWNSSNDLPAHIDVVIRRSADNGQTWSSPLTIAGAGNETGFGDPALVLNRKNGEIICLLASDRGFFYSTASAPIRIYQSKSADNGISWSTPQDITSQLYGANCPNPVTQKWQGAFVTSGAATQLRNGRLMAVLSVRENTNYSVSDFVIYSDDNAKTWKVSLNRASAEGSEAKLVELDNGFILMSIRHRGRRHFTISRDQGMTWGTPYTQPDFYDPSCNGDMIRWTSITDGFSKNRLIHSIPFSTGRANLSVLLSYDEGETWPVRKTIYPGLSAYSSLSILDDGTIGMYCEVGEYETYQMYFTRFSLEWLSDGADTWTNKLNTFINSSDDITVATPAFQVYPNPASEAVHVSGTFGSNQLVELYSIEGILMNRTRVDNPGNQIDLSLRGLTPGIYLLKIGNSITRLVVGQ